MTTTTSAPTVSPSVTLTAYTAASISGLLDVCEEFLRTASPATQAELAIFLDRQSPPADTSWLLDMLGFTSAHLRHRLPAHLQPDRQPGARP